ncbi:hypothetical protein ASF62_02210 [Leifsonia sp. Leaf325]|nr:hypothetical protein [Leifsonia sp. Leaf325]KQQ95375.1 hypothetical protein ASF62_02210 [Leifsonia sp. Leaf325]
MKRWILLTAALVVGVIAAAVALPGVVGTSYAAWNATAPVAAGVSAGTWSATPTPPPAAGPYGGISAGTPETGFSSIAFVDQSPGGFCVDTAVTTTSTTPITWQIKVDISAIPFNGLEPSQVTNAQKKSTTNGIVFYGGLSGSEKIVSGQSITVKMCQWQGNAPAILASGPTSYTVSTSILRTGSDEYTACVDTVVTGKSTFYVGYEVAFNWQQVLTAATWLPSETRTKLLAKTLNNWTTKGSWAVVRNGYDYTGHGTNTHSNASITNGQTVTVAACI